MNVQVYLVGRAEPLSFTDVHLSWAADPRGTISLLEIYSGPVTNPPIADKMIASWHVNHVAGWCKA